MQIFRYRSGKDRKAFGFTRQQDGQNLPSEFAPWTLLDDLPAGEMSAGEAGVGVLACTDEVLNGVESDGYYLARLVYEEPFDGRGTIRVPDDPEQSRRFIETAQEVGKNNHDYFGEAFERVAKSRTASKGRGEYPRKGHRPKL